MKRQLLSLGIVLGVYVLFAAFTLLDYPPVYSDEPWLLSGPVSLLRDGRNALPMFGESYSASLYFNAYLVPFLALLGASVETGRLVALAHGTGALVLVWLIARELGAVRRAWLAPALVLLAFPFLAVTRYVRPEAFELFYCLLAVWLYLHGRQRSWTWSFGAGVAAGAALGLSYKSAWVAVLLAVWVLLDRSARRASHVAAGAALALVPLILFVASDPDEYRRFLRKFGGSSIFAERYETDPVGSFGTLIRREPDRYQAFATAVDSRVYLAVVVVLVLGALGVALARRQWRLLLLAALPPLEFALLAENKTPAYLAVAAPGLAILAVLALERVGDVVVASALAVLAVTYVGVIERHVPDVSTGFGEVRERYRTAVAISAGSLVIGLPTAYAYYLDDPVDFRALHYFTDFDTFELDTAAEARAKLDRERRPVYLLRSQALLDTLAQFSATRALPEELRKVLETEFRPVATLRFNGTANGAYEDTIARYAPGRAG